MEITIEQVERLMERADVSYEEAKEALEATGGSLLDAIIKLERDGKTLHRSSAYSTNGALPTQYAEEKAGQTDSSGQNGADSKYSAETASFIEALKKIWHWILRLLHKSAINHFEVYHRGESIVSIPVIILVILLVFFFWITLPVLVIALFFGCRYRFRGPDLGKDAVNRAMDSAADTAEELKQSVKDSANNAKS